MPNEGNEAVGAKGPQTFCTYTNADYNNGRGVSLVVTPEVAASVTMETFGMSIGGMEGVGQGHPWDEKEGEGHEHGHEH
jgi:hypothetical protein